MAYELLTDAERKSLLPIIPVIARPDIVETVRKEYDSSLRIAGEGDDYFANGIGVGIGRAVIKHRFTQAKAIEAHIKVDDRMKEEYGRLFAGTDLSGGIGSPEKRADLFLASKYLPSFELFVRHTTGERTSAVSTAMAERVFQLLIEQYELKENDENDTLRTRIRVMNIINRDSKKFGIVRTKIDGLTASQTEPNGGQSFDVKFRRSGVVRLDRMKDEDIVEDFKILENLETDKSVPLEDVEVFRRGVVNYLKHTDNYRPIIERAYMTRRKLPTLQQ